MQHERPTHYAIEDGEIVFTWPQEGDDRKLAELPHGFWLQIDGEVHEAKRWNGSGFDDRVDHIRDRLWQRVKQHRDEAICAGVDVEGVGRVDSDDTSRAAIDSRLVGSSREGWTTAWTLADNSAATIDAAQMLAIKHAVDDHVDKCRARAAMLRVQLRDAQTVSELLVVEQFDPMRVYVPPQPLKRGGPVRARKIALESPANDKT